MAFKLGKLFKKKPGGTMFGNALRGITKLAADSGLVPGAGLVNSLLPSAPPLVLEVAQEAVAQAVQAPTMDFSSLSAVKNFAAGVKSDLLAAGATTEQATNIGAVAFTAASLPPAEAVATLDVVKSNVDNVPINSFGAGDIKKMLNGAVAGARDGATSAYLNETETGKAQKKGAINAEGAKVMPWLLGIMAGVIGLLLIKKN